MNPACERGGPGRCGSLAWSALLAVATLWSAPAVALASAAKEPAEGAAEHGLLGPPILYSIQWGLLLGLLFITALFVIGMSTGEMHKRPTPSRAKGILAFSALQILLVFGVLILNVLGAAYHEPALPGYLRHVTLIITGILLSASGLMARRRRP